MVRENVCQVGKRVGVRTTWKGERGQGTHFFHETIGFELVAVGQATDENTFTMSIQAG